MNLYLLIIISHFFAGAFSISEETNPIAIRHDKPDSAYRELGNQFSSVVRVGKNAGDGTLIAPQWILTAGHVASGMARRSGGNFSVWVGEDEVEVPIEQVIVHPEFTRMGPHDIALIKLSRPITDIEPINLYSRDDELGNEVILVGHGYTKPGSGGEWEESRDKRGATNKIDEVNDQHIVFTFDAPGSSNTTELEGTPGPGDSGGPAFIKRGDQYYIAGVSSMGFDGDNGPGTYGAKDFFVRVSSYASWINEMIENPPSERLVNVQSGLRRRSAGTGGPQVVIEGPDNVPEGIVEIREWGLLFRERDDALVLVGRIDELVPEAITKLGIRPSTRIFSVNDIEIKGGEQLKELLSGIKEGQSYSIVFENGGERFNVELQK